jgi:glucosamine--fructose-6-phosphate aminotransferase (isomerizing)
MEKEIFEQPTAVSNSFMNRIDSKNGTTYLKGLRLDDGFIKNINRIHLFGCGTSLHAAMLGQSFFENIAQIPCDVIHSAELRYKNFIVDENDLGIGLSQSGETADTLAAVQKCKDLNMDVVSLVNVVGSTIARETGKGIYLNAGPEISVASTKAFTCQVTGLLQMAIKFGRLRNQLSRSEGINLCKELKNMPGLISDVLDNADEIERMSEKFEDAHSSFFLGREYMFPVALEGALKLKEISYIHAEGYHAAELKHGPIALLDEKVPVIALANKIHGQDKILGNIAECTARKAPVILTATEGDETVKELSEDIIWIPEASPEVTTILTTVALQLLSYYVALSRGCNVDQPKNLAKSVTVE